jgi:hypothetical protein
MHSLAWLVLLAALPCPRVEGGDGGDGAAGIETITEDELAAHVRELAAPEIEGRASPSEGLTRAAAYIEARFREAGLTGAGKEGSFRLGYVQDLVAPNPSLCRLEVTRKGEPALRLELEQDFVPLPECRGEAAGTLVFAGFGITDSKERYDDLKGTKVKDKIALVLEGEPRHKKLFDGPAITAAADVYAKVLALEDAGAKGVLVVRRPPPERTAGADGKPMPATELGYRYLWAPWNPALVPPPPERTRVPSIPALEITGEVASSLLGEDVEELAVKIDRGGKPLRRELDEVSVSLASSFQRTEVPLENVAGIVAGTDPALAGEFVVIGAHYDHIGVDTWGRIGCGADDNASGTAALLELAQAFAAAPARRGIVFAAFSAEEEGLIGSAFFVDEPPVPTASMVAMLNMDMIGRGDPDEVVVIGTKQNPALMDVLERAKKLHPTGLARVITGKAEEFWERSDQFSFHKKGVPVLFFFECVTEAENPDYHTFRDTIELLEIPKMARITRLVFNTAWVLAQNDECPPPPKR